MLDLLVLGSGIAGLSAALRAAGDHRLSVGLLTKGGLPDAATRWAQGGVAAVLGGADDSTDLHLADTLAVGVGLCDPDAVRVMVDEGPDRVSELVDLGARFDRDPDGQLSLGREGGHSVSRVVHAGGAATGAEIERVLVAAVRRTATVIHEHAFAMDLVVDDGRCTGVVALLSDGSVTTVRARNVLLATGGAGQLFAVTTNPLEATGDGIAMALRAGVATADLEFVQFHPTALHIDRSPRPLLSEAMRGDGAILRDTDGERFVDEMEPRDVVSRAMTRRMLDQQVDHLWLDATAMHDVAGSYPSITAVLAGAGLDPATDWLPVAPAAHYLCGGAVTDLDGATTLPGLWAAGEVACSGVHGANRLASNSLLEGLVFGSRAAAAVAAGRFGASPTGAMAAVVGGATPAATRPSGGGDLDHIAPGARMIDLDVVCDVGASGCDPAGAVELRRLMTSGAGLLRNRASLTDVAAALHNLSTRRGDGSVDALETANLIAVAAASVAAALERTESRGVHTRTDCPDTDPDQRCRIVGRPRVAVPGSFDAAGSAGAG
jgi:L-aspartate oxidase